MNAQLISKVLIHEEDRGASERIKSFCDEHNLVGVKGPDQNVMDALAANIDLGGVFLTGSETGMKLGLKIHSLRPELPIFLRLPEMGPSGSSECAQRISVAAYRIDSIESLENSIDRYIFNRHFPAGLVRGVAEISLEALRSQFPKAEVRVEAPYLVNDRLIHGQLFSLMPLETRWCRGYMMLQGEESALEQAIRLNRTLLPSDPSGFREANAVLGEVSNLIWGRIRARFGCGNYVAEASRTQVPILINQQEKYISFGAGEPQLCFHYILSDADRGPAIELYQKFIFNLSWTPELFSDARPVDDYVQAGELELF